MRIPESYSKFWDKNCFLSILCFETRTRFFAQSQAVRPERESRLEHFSGEFYRMKLFPGLYDWKCHRKAPNYLNFSEMFHFSRNFNENLIFQDVWRRRSFYQHNCRLPLKIVEKNDTLFQTCLPLLSFLSSTNWQMFSRILTFFLILDATV